MKIENRVNSGFKGKLDDFNDLQPIGFKNPYHSEITKESILKRGFVQPFAMCELDGQLYVLDGHLRKDLINELINDGHKVPTEFSYFLVDVGNDRKKAIDTLLSFNVKTNPINEESIIEWLEVEEIEVTEVKIETLNIVSEMIEEDEDHKENIKELSNMIACTLTDEESEIWLKTKESMGKMKDKNAIFELIKLYSNETNIK